MTVFSAFWTVGTILEASLAWVVMPSLGWRGLLALSAVPSSFLLIFYSKTPESPRYLCMKGRTNDALLVLKRISIMNQTELPSGTVLSDYRAVQMTKIPSEDSHLLSPTIDGNGTHDNMSSDIQTGANGTHDNTSSKSSNKQTGASISMLLSPSLLRSTLLLWVVFFGNAFSYYGLVLLTTGFNIKSSNCSSTHLESMKTAEVSYKDIFITSLAEFPGLLISALVVDRFGRKLSMSVLFFVCCIFLLPLAFKQFEGLATLLLSGARVCITATFTIVYIYAPEVYPTTVRTTGVGVASSMGRIGGMLCPVVAVSLIRGCHRTASILLFEVVLFVSGICVAFFPFETKGVGLANDVSDMGKDVNLSNNNDDT